LKFSYQKILSPMTFSSEFDSQSIGKSGTIKNNDRSD
jgi:hypothetical protein